MKAPQALFIRMSGTFLFKEALQNPLRTVLLIQNAAGGEVLRIPQLAYHSSKAHGNFNF